MSLASVPPLAGLLGPSCLWVVSYSEHLHQETQKSRNPGHLRLGATSVLSQNPASHHKLTDIVVLAFVKFFLVLVCHIP